MIAGLELDVPGEEFVDALGRVIGDAGEQLMRDDLVGPLLREVSGGVPEVFEDDRIEVTRESHQHRGRVHSLPPFPSPPSNRRRASSCWRCNDCARWAAYAWYGSSFESHAAVICRAIFGSIFTR